VKTDLVIIEILLKKIINRFFMIQVYLKKIDFIENELKKQNLKINLITNTVPSGSGMMNHQCPESFHCFNGGKCEMVLIYNQFKPKCLCKSGYTGFKCENKSKTKL
jgi:hypothetical protein